MRKARKIGKNGLQFLRVREGLPGTGGAPALVAYLDDAGIPTLGFGHTRGVKLGMTCTEDQAEQWLLADAYEAQVCVDNAVKVRLTQNQFDALVCFAFNIGPNSFRDSTLLKLLNQGNYESVPDQMRRWNKGHVNGHLIVIDGLTNRRELEINELWLKA